MVPLLLQGMQALVKERPNNPVEFLAGTRANVGGLGLGSWVHCHAFLARV